MGRRGGMSHGRRHVIRPSIPMHAIPLWLMMLLAPPVMLRLMVLVLVAFRLPLSQRTVAQQQRAQKAPVVLER